MHAVHLVGSIGLDTVDEVFQTTGKLLGPYLKRVPDGEPGGRRLWTSWQYPLLRANPFLRVDRSKTSTQSTGFLPLTLAEGVSVEEVRFGELGYAREARASYQDFLQARDRGVLPRDVRFQVCLPTPFAVIGRTIVEEVRPAVLAAYEAAMLREVRTICAAIPHADLALQWDVCFEMLIWDGRWAAMPPFEHMDKYFSEMFQRISEPVPTDVQLGFHLCYGDLDAAHFIEPQDAAKMAEFANLIVANARPPIAWVHMPVPIARHDDAFFAPLKNLRLPQGTELYLGLVHARDGIEGTKRRMAAARKIVNGFGIAAECGMARARSPETVLRFLEVHAGAAAAPAG
jgi:methionine synthase II (cobalamin-independent)